MGINTPNPNVHDAVSIRQAIKRLSKNLGRHAVPTFSGLTLSSLTPSRLTSSDASKSLVSTDLVTWVAGTANRVTVADDGDGSITLSAPQDLHTSADFVVNSVYATSMLVWDNTTKSICIGYQAEDITENQVTAVGYQAGNGSSIHRATYIGYLAGINNTQAGSTMIGWRCGENNISNNFTAVGDAAGINSSGNACTYVGSGGGNTHTGADSVCIGVQTGRSATGRYGVHIGNNSGAFGSGVDQVNLGYNAGGSSSADDSICIGTTAGTSSTGDRSQRIGTRAGFQNTGYAQLAIGYYAGYQGANTDQISLGYEAGYTNTADYQVVLGRQAGYNNSGTHQIAMGYHAGHSNTSGDQVALGQNAGELNTGANQISIGDFAGYRNSSSSTVTIGNLAGYDNRSGSTVAIGPFAGYVGAGGAMVTIGSSNGYQACGADLVAIGTQAGQYNDGINNVAIGKSSFNTFNTNAGGVKTFAFGDVDAGTNRITIAGHGFGANNSYHNLEFIEGTSALPGLFDDYFVFKIIDANTVELQSENITSQGSGTGHTLTPQTDYTNSTAIGYDAEPTASNQIVLGDANVTTMNTVAVITSPTINLTDNTDLLRIDGTTTLRNDGTANFAFGVGAGSVTMGSGNTLFGEASGGLLNYSAGNEASFNLCMGYNAGAALTTGFGHVALGYSALAAAVGSNSGVAIGWNSCRLTTENANVGVGTDTLYTNTDGTGNIALGYQCLYSLTGGDGDFNIAIGYQAGYSTTTGGLNVAIGYNSLYENLTGVRNVGVGSRTLSQSLVNDGTAVGYWSSRDITGIRNTSIGSYTLRTATDADYNAVLGAYGGFNLTTGDNNVFLGYGAGYRQTTNSNLLIVDSIIRASAAAEQTDSLLYGTTSATRANQELNVNATLVLPKPSGYGIKVDATTPTYSWRDLLGPVAYRGVGASDPNLATYRGNIKQYQFAVGDEAWFEFHIPHDYVAGSDIHIHIHWSHIGTLVTGGSITWGFDVTYAKGHDQAAFPATVNPTLVANASTTQYQHSLDEVQASATSPSATQIDSDDLEPDGVVLIRSYLSANNITVSGGATPDPFIHYVDIHYQSTGIGTKQKAPDFYS